jgi:hypothetical protein
MFGVPLEPISLQTLEPSQRYASAAAVNAKRAVAVDGPSNGKILHVPSPNPTVNRRRVLIGAAALALFSASVVACGSSPVPPEVDELAAQLKRARTDSQLATDAAATARGATVQTLNTVASERAAHAQALTDELVRMRGADAPTSVTSEPTTTAETVQPPTVQDVIDALRQSADSATELATTMSGYRAGLLASIAAACTAAYTVALDPSGSPR